MSGKRFIWKRFITYAMLVGLLVFPLGYVGAEQTDDAKQKAIDDATQESQFSPSERKDDIEEVDDIRDIVTELEETGAIEDEEVVRHLQTHLKSVRHFEQQQHTEKVVKHLDHFRELIKQKNNMDLISDEGYEKLQMAAVSLMVNIQGDDAVSSQKQLFRSSWIASVDNIDWPSEQGLSADEQKDELKNALDADKEAGMNATIVQIKPAADAFFPSDYAPWSKYLTGEQGKDPGYDPVSFAVEEAHARNMEFHAWMNPYRVANDTTDTGDLVEGHPAREHPEWVIEYGGQLYYDPGNPDAREYIIDSFLEVVENYDVDAIHMDDYFYPYPVEGETFDDEETYQEYGADQFDDKEDWRRHNVDVFVEELSEGIKDIDSHVKLGISPFGIWRNASTDPEGSDTNGLESYDDLYADTKKWVEHEWIDYINPQIYWYFENPPAAYEKLADWWSDLVADKDVHLYTGHAAYQIGSGGEWDDPEEVPDQLAYNTSLNIDGSVFFSHQDLVDNPLGITDRLKNDLFKNPALVPTMSWLGGEAPEKPDLLSVKSTDEGNEVEWEDADDESAYYVIYRFEDDSDVDLDDPNHMIETVRNDGDDRQSFVDDAVEGTDYSYGVTSVDRLHHESDPSDFITPGD